MDEQRQKAQRFFKIVDLLREQIQNLIYVKADEDCLSLRRFKVSERCVLHNLFNVLEVKKKLYTIRTSKAALGYPLHLTYKQYQALQVPGALQFSSNFESGNLNYVVQSLQQSNLYYVHMSPDTNSAGHTKWFHFKVSKGKKGERCIFKVINFRREKLKTDQFSVCAFSKKRNERDATGWQRLTSSIKCFENDTNPFV